MDRTITSAVTLDGGVDMPWFGLGVFKAAAGGEARAAVRHALDVGYRRIDTAAIYGNESDVGEGIRDSSVPREDIFITTKVWDTDHGREQAVAACHASLERLGTDYIDLYLIHWPVEGLRDDTWQALCDLREQGTCRAIGVSNYTIRHLTELLGNHPGRPPAVNQVEFSPFLYQQDLLAYCRDHGVVLEAYSPLTRGQKFDHPALTELAGRYGKTPAQLMIRWVLQHDVAVIPKSANPARISENAAVFDFALSDEDMARMDELDEGFRVAWDPTDAP